MSDTKFTRGPWRETENGAGFIRGAEGNAVASVYGDDPECHPDERMHANCCLIAAAPDMYQVLMDVLSDLEIGAHPQLYIDQIKTALAKARGENNG